MLEEEYEMHIILNRYKEIFNIHKNEEKTYRTTAYPYTFREIKIKTFGYDELSKQIIKNMKVDAALVILPINLELKTKPFSLLDNHIKAYIEKIQHTFNSISKSLYTLLNGSGLLFVYGYPQLFPYVSLILSRNEMFYFRYWIVIERWDVDKWSTPLRPVHEGFLLMIRRPYSVSKIRTVRSPHLKCKICGELLRDWGGKKHLLNPEGYAIYDIWYEIPMYLPIIHNKCITFTNDVFDRLLLLTNMNNTMFPVFLPDNIDCIKIYDDLYSPIKTLIVPKEEIEQLKKRRKQ